MDIEVMTVHKQPAAKKRIKLTFDQVEAILGTPLPRSATRLTTWCTNVQPKIQSHRTAWLNQGWTVKEFDLQAKMIDGKQDKLILH